MQHYNDGVSLIVFGIIRMNQMLLLVFASDLLILEENKCDVKCSRKNI